MLKLPRRAPTLSAASVSLLVAVTAAGNAKAQLTPTLQLPESMPQDEPAPAPDVAPEPTVAIATPPPTLPLARAPLPQMPRLGLAARGLGSFIINGNPYVQYGVGAALLYRISPRLTTELHIQYHATAPGLPSGSTVERRDIPVLLGLRLHLGSGRSLLSPYLAVTVGADAASTTFNAGVQTTDWYFAMTYGAGAELRLGGHCALTIDVRGNTLVRLNQPEPAASATPTEVAAQTFPSQGIQLAGGVEVYF